VALRLEVLPPRCRPDLSGLKVRRRRLRVRAPGRRDGATPLSRRCGGAARGLPSCRSSDDLARGNGRSHRIGQGGRAERVRVAAEGCLGTVRGELRGIEAIGHGGEPRPSLLRTEHPALGTSEKESTCIPYVITCT
jgi:hypothetical protein